MWRVCRVERGLLSHTHCPDEERKLSDSVTVLPALRPGPLISCFNGKLNLLQSHKILNQSLTLLFKDTS